MEIADRGYVLESGRVVLEGDSQELLKTVKRALNYYSKATEKEITDLRSKIMDQNFSWGESVKKYLELYKNLVKNN